MKKLAVFLAIMMSFNCLVFAQKKGKAKKELTKEQKKAFEVLERYEKPLTNYYKNPDPDSFFDMVNEMSSLGVFDDVSVKTMIAVFASYIFKQSPENIPLWVEKILPVTEKYEDFVLLSLWYSSVPQAKEIIKSVYLKSSEDKKEKIKPFLEQKHIPFEKWPARSPMVLDAWWTGFLVTGDVKYVEFVIKAIPLFEIKTNVNKTIIGGAARWSVASNARQHRKVYDYIVKRNKEVKDKSTPFLIKVIKEINSEKKVKSK